jgi:hypothetical protein
MAGISASLEQIALQKSARYITWLTLTSSSTTMPPTGTVGDATNVSGYQLAKIALSASLGVTVGFNIQYKYAGDDTFYRIDQSDRTGINHCWTQQVDVSAVEYIYVCVTSYSGAGNYVIKIGVGDDAP